MTDYDYHEYSNIFPMMSDVEINDLASDIRKNGLKSPIILHQAKVLDGRNRQKACKICGVEPTYTIYYGDDPLSYVISLNLNRRHMSESQRAMVAAKIANMPSGYRTDLDPNANLRGVNSIDSAAESFSVSPRSVNYAKRVQKDGTEKLKKAVYDGKMSVSGAATILDMPPKYQNKVAGSDNPTKEIRKLRVDRALEKKGIDDFYSSDCDSDDCDDVYLKIGAVRAQLSRESREDLVMALDCVLSSKCIKKE